MKLSEKKVLIVIGILFVIVAAVLNLGDIEIAEQIEKQPTIGSATSSFNVNDGKLTLQFEKSTKELLFLSNNAIR